MANALPLAPQPQLNVPLSVANGQPSQGLSSWITTVHTRLNTGNFPALSVNGVAALTTALGVTLTGGVQETPFDLGTPTNGSTITPNPSSELFQKVANNVAAFTIAATAQVGCIILLITNGASAGTITFSGFTKQFAGDALDTTNGHKFMVVIYGLPNSNSAYLIKALQ